MFTKRGCPYTGSTEDIHSEWEVPRHLTRNREQDFKGLKIDGTNETVDEDYQLLGSASTFADGAAANIKTEPEAESETSKMASRLDAFIASKDAVLRKFQDFKVEAKAALSKAQRSKDKNTKYAAAVIADLEKHVPKLEKCSKLLERVCTEVVEDPNRVSKTHGVNREPGGEAQGDPRVGC